MKDLWIQVKALFYERCSHSNALKRGYCWFRLKWKPQDGLLGSEGTCESFRCAQITFFKLRIPNFIAPKGLDRNLLLWWNQRERYLTEQECLTCVDNFTIAQLTQKQSKRQRLESNAGPYPERQKTLRDEHEIYPADPDATVAHDSRSVRWRAVPGRSGEGGSDFDCAGDVGIIGDAQARMSCRVAGQDPCSSARQAFAPRAAPGRGGGRVFDTAGVVDADMAMESFESSPGIDNLIGGTVLRGNGSALVRNGKGDANLTRNGKEDAKNSGNGRGDSKSSWSGRDDACSKTTSTTRAAISGAGGGGSSRAQGPQATAAATITP